MKKLVRIILWTPVILLSAFFILLQMGSGSVKKPTQQQNEITQAQLDQDASEGKSAKKKTEEMRKKAEAERIKNNFRVWSQVDEMTGEKTYYLSSRSVKSTRPMGFPYRGTEAWIGAGCSTKSKDLWAYTGYTSSPNLTDDETKDGYNLVKTRVSLDGKIDTVTFTQEWGAKFLHARYDNDFIKKVTAYNEIIIELRWHGEGATRFKFDLRGSSAAFKDLKRKCGIE